MTSLKNTFKYRTSSLNLSKRCFLGYFRHFNVIPYLFKMYILLYIRNALVRYQNSSLASYSVVFVLKWMMTILLKVQNISFTFIWQCLYCAYVCNLSYQVFYISLFSTYNQKKVMLQKCTVNFSIKVSPVDLTILI